MARKTAEEMNEERRAKKAAKRRGGGKKEESQGFSFAPSDKHAASKSEYKQRRRAEWQAKNDAEMMRREGPRVLKAAKAWQDWWLKEAKRDGVCIIENFAEPGLEFRTAISTLPERLQEEADNNREGYSFLGDGASIQTINYIGSLQHKVTNIATVSLAELQDGKTKAKQERQAKKEEKRQKAKTKSQRKKLRQQQMQAS